MFKYIHAFGPSCAEFVYHGYWYFDKGATSKIDDVLTEHDLSVSPSQLGILGLIGSLNWVGLSWGWAKGVWGLRVWGQGLTIVTTKCWP